MVRGLRTDCLAAAGADGLDGSERWSIGSDDGADRGVEPSTPSQRSPWSAFGQEPDWSKSVWRHGPAGSALPVRVRRMASRAEMALELAGVAAQRRVGQIRAACPHATGALEEFLQAGSEGGIAGLDRPLCVADQMGEADLMRALPSPSGRQTGPRPRYRGGARRGSRRPRP